MVVNDKSISVFTLQGDSRSINALVRSFISDKKNEDIPSVRILLYSLLWLCLLNETLGYIKNDVYVSPTVVSGIVSKTSRHNFPNSH